MGHGVAAGIVALRPALEAMIVGATTQPEGIAEPTPLDEQLMNLVRELSKPSAGKFGVKEENQG